MLKCRLCGMVIDKNYNGNVFSIMMFEAGSGENYLDTGVTREVYYCHDCFEQCIGGKDFIDDIKKHGSESKF